MKFLIVIGGPTGSGKTDLAIRLARHFDTEILSADSRQFYREMSIGTAKPDAEQLAQVKHHFINSLSIHQAYSAGDFERDALHALRGLFEKKEIAILTGGSGLFLKALCEGLDDFPEVPLAIREALEERLEKEGIEALQVMLAESDPEYFQEVDRNNPRRLIRALSVIHATGRTYTSFRVKRSTPRPFVPIYLELTWRREVLYQRINQRVDQMLEKGLLREAHTLIPWKNLPALKTVGYQELFPYFEGNCSLEDAIEQIRQHSRNYAKRQLTWSRRDGYWKHFSPDEWDLILQYIYFSTQQLIFWEQKMFPDMYPGTMNPRHRLSLYSDAGPLAFMEYGDSEDQRLWLPTPLPENQGAAKWVLHEAIHRAEGKPILAFLEKEWVPLLQKYSFTVADLQTIGKKNQALAKRLPWITPFLKK
jgi:tRNA dimethylallyltransferase